MTFEIQTGDCLKVMSKMSDESVDLVVTSPPYDNLRSYKGYFFDFEATARELFRVIKKGGVIVWVIGDKVNRGNKSLTSFRQAIYFQNIGFNVHDVMIYKKKNTPFMRSNGYTNCFEFMFVLSKGSPKTFHPIKEPTARSGVEQLPFAKGKDGINKKRIAKLNELKTKNNIWEYAVGFGGTTKDKIAFKHPAIFPEALAKDHILSWSNEGDLVFDPFVGSGTTAKMAVANGRNFIGCDISEDYVEIAIQRTAMVKGDNND